MESSIAVGGIVGVSLGLSLSLGHVDNSSRVGNIPASTSIASSNGWHSSRGQAIDAHRGGGTHTGITSGKAKTIGICSVGTISTSTINTSTINTSPIGISTVGTISTSTINTGTINTSSIGTSIAICSIVRV